MAITQSSFVIFPRITISWLANVYSVVWLSTIGSLSPSTLTVSSPKNPSLTVSPTFLAVVNLIRPSFVVVSEEELLVDDLKKGIALLARRSPPTRKSPSKTRVIVFCLIRIFEFQMGIMLIFDCFYIQSIGEIIYPFAKTRDLG